MQLHDTLELRLGLELRPWRESGITPLWWILKGSHNWGIEGHWGRIMSRVDDVRPYEDSLYIPIRLKAGVSEADVIANAVEQMRSIAASLRDTCIREQG